MLVFIDPDPLFRAVVSRKESGGRGRRGCVVIWSLLVLAEKLIAFLLHSSNFLPEYLILFAEVLVLLLHLLGDVLQSDIALDFPLFVRMQASLKLGELSLLAFTKSTLGGSVRGKLAPVGECGMLGVPCLFCTRLLADDSSSCSRNQCMSEHWIRKDERHGLRDWLGQCWAPSSAFGRALAWRE